MVCFSITCIFEFFFFLGYLRSDSGDLEREREGVVLTVCWKPWGLCMIRISVEAEMSLNAQKANIKILFNFCHVVPFWVTLMSFSNLLYSWALCYYIHDLYSPPHFYFILTADPFSVVLPLISAEAVWIAESKLFWEWESV